MLYVEYPSRGVSTSAMYSVIIPGVRASEGDSRLLRESYCFNVCA